MPPASDRNILIGRPPTADRRLAVQPRDEKDDDEDEEAQDQRDDLDLAKQVLEFAHGTPWESIICASVCSRTCEPASPRTATLRITELDTVHRVLQSGAVATPAVVQNPV